MGTDYEIYYRLGYNYVEFDNLNNKKEINNWQQVDTLEKQYCQRNLKEFKSGLYSIQEVLQIIRNELTKEGYDMFDALAECDDGLGSLALAKILCKIVGKMRRDLVYSVQFEIKEN